MGSFDDLIPDNKPQGFDDLVPQKRADFSGVSARVNSTARPPMRPGASRHAGQYGITPYLLDFADALGHHGMNALHGGAQAVEHGFQWGVNQLIDAPEQTLSGLITGQAPQP